MKNAKQLAGILIVATTIAVTAWAYRYGTDNQTRKYESAMREMHRIDSLFKKQNGQFRQFLYEIKCLQDSFLFCKRVSVPPPGYMTHIRENWKDATVDTLYAMVMQFRHEHPATWPVIEGHNLKGGVK